MPIYDYLCNECGSEFAIAQSYKNYEKSKGKICCDDCGSKNVKRVILPSPVIYKDSGFTLKTSESQ